MSKGPRAAPGPLAHTTLDRSTVMGAKARSSGGGEMRGPVILRQHTYKRERNGAAITGRAGERVGHSVRRLRGVPVAEHTEGRPESALGVLLVERVVDAGYVQRVDRGRQLLHRPHLLA
jgi:hypothetical protein